MRCCWYSNTRACNFQQSAVAVTLNTWASTLIRLSPLPSLTRAADLSSNVPFLYLRQTRGYLKITILFGLMARARIVYGRSRKRLRAGKSTARRHFPTDLSEQSVDSRFHSSDYEDFSLEGEERTGASDAVGCVGSECNNVCRRVCWRQQNLRRQGHS